MLLLVPQIEHILLYRVIGGLFDRLDRYRVEGENMSRSEFLAESHKSDRLGRYMTRAGDPRPSKRCDAHAIIENADLKGVFFTEDLGNIFSNQFDGNIRDANR